MYTASANIRPSRFVKKSGLYTVAEASTGERMMGISAEFSNYAPLPSQTEYLAASGDPVSMIINGDGQQEDRPVLLVIGSGGCVFGDLLKSDSAGAGVIASTDKDCYGALALGTAASGEAVPVRLLFGYLGV